MYVYDESAVWCPAIAKRGAKIDLDKGVWGQAWLHQIVIGQNCKERTMVVNSNSL